MDFYITNEEIEALKLYKEMNYEPINRILVSNSEIDVNLLSDESDKKKVEVSYSKENVKKYIDIIKKIYELMQKKYSSQKDMRLSKFYRGTNISEIERIKNEPYIDRFLSVTNDEKIAKERYASDWNRPAMLDIKIESNIPYINVNEILKNGNPDFEYIISPFTIIKEITEKQEENFENTSKTLKRYEISLIKQDLEPLSQDERNGLFNYVMNNADNIENKLEEAIALEKVNLENYENIRKLEQLLSKYEIENEKKESQVDFDDIDRINKQLDEIKLECSEIFKQKKDIINFVTNWKRNLILFLMAECKEIEEKYKVSYQNEEEKANENIIEEYKVQMTANNVEVQTVEEPKETAVQVLEKIDENDSNLKVKKECDENIEAVEKLLNNIQKLITKQQNHAKIAGNLGTTYSALNNGFEMRKIAENLDILLKNIKLKVNSIIQEEKEEELLNEKLENISKVNIQINTLLNYLNNPKSSIGIANITRFDEMAIIEENELKRGIYQTVRDTMGEAELKKLKDDLTIIEEKSPIEKLMGIFTGKNKLDEIMVEQIEIRQNAIRKTLSQKLSLANNYSIHEIVALMQMFIRENFDDNLILDDVSDLEQLDRELRSNFVILDTKIESIITEKEGRNLPLENKKITKKEALEIDTYRFLNKYGYDIKKENDADIKYQDTMANEIARIVEYINSSNVL